MALATGNPPKPRGRRPDPAKRQAIFEAAREVFFTEGYGASMDAIAGRAGVSKQTIYNAFATKDELFAAIIADTSARMIAPLERHAPETPPNEVLTELARHYLELVLSDRSVALLRMLATQRAHFPQLVETFYRNGPANTLARTAGYLAEETVRGRLAVADPVLAAEQFFGMLGGVNHMRRLIGVGRVPGPEERERRIAACVQAFLKAHGPA
jgi:TetR/AcrR family transcriptional repressor of mexJK operon